MGLLPTLKFRDFASELAATLKKEGAVRVTGVGVFTVRTLKARQGRNPRTGEAVEIPTRRRIAFKASKYLKDAAGI